MVPLSWKKILEHGCFSSSDLLAAGLKFRIAYSEGIHCKGLRSNSVSLVLFHDEFDAVYAIGWIPSGMVPNRSAKEKERFFTSKSIPTWLRNALVHTKNRNCFTN